MTDGRSMKFRPPVLLGVILALVLAAGLWLWRSNSGERAGEREVGEQIAIGARLYGEHCASCHGAQLEGQPNWRERRPDGRLPAPPHDASGHTWHHSDTQIFAITKHGMGPFAPRGYASDMPAYAGRLADGEIRAVVDFIKSTWPDDIRRRQHEINRRSADR